MMQNSKDHNATLSASDDPATTRTGGPSTNRPFNPHLNLNLNNIGAIGAHLGTARVTAVKNSPFPSNQGQNYSMRTAGGNPAMDSTKTLSKNS